MSYRIKEIYFTQQGEGSNTGRDFVFVRFSGCNLWSGKQKNRKSESNMMGIQIIDNGKGIPTEHIYRLTERFYRVNADLSRERQGTGLGLSIVKHILNRHKGELEIESVPEKGSIFTTWLPVSKTDFKQIKRDKAA